MDKPTKLKEKNLQAAIAIVDAALLGFEGQNKLFFHPRLKKMIAIEIATDPSLTKDLFKPNFLDTFAAKISRKNN